MTAGPAANRLAIRFAVHTFGMIHTGLDIALMEVRQMQLSSARICETQNLHQLSYPRCYVLLASV
jgi:hypothetical protein